MKIDNIEQFMISCYDTKTGHFKWCKDGSNKLFDGGLGVQSLALKIIYIMSLQDKFDINKIADSIMEFQTDDGFFVDFSLDRNTIRAETRQALSALKNFEIKPRKELEFIKDFNTFDKANKFLTSLNWNNPWAAGSHLSHLMFFLKDDFSELNNEIAEKFLQSIWRGDGWYAGNVKDTVKINGIMKVISGLVAANIKQPYPEQIIDYCLNLNNVGNGCNILDFIFNLYYCHLGSEYKTKQIKDCFDRYMNVIERHWKGDGFSFYENRSQDHYLGAPNITSGKNESDIHGTILFLWALSLINDFSGNTQLKIQTT